MKQSYYHAKKPPKKNKKRQYKEHAHQVAIFKQAALYEPQYPLLALLQGSLAGVNLDIVKAKRAKDAGVKAGFPDINLPVARGGYLGLYIELKTTWGSVSPAQDRIMNMLTNQGHLVLLLKGYTALKVFEIIIQYLQNQIVKPEPPPPPPPPLQEEKPDEKTQLRNDRPENPLQISGGENESGQGPGI
jgi:hypothetical protein